MRRLVALGLMWLILATLISCKYREGDVTPSIDDGYTPPVEMPDTIAGNRRYSVDIDPEPTPEPEPEYSEEPVVIPCYTEDELIQVAKFLYQEARGIPSDTRVACCAWIVCNRVDGGYGDTISAIWGYPQIWYEEDWPVTDRMYNIAKDVLDRWSTERQFGYCEGRVLPADYFWYTGDGVDNYFRNVFNDYDNVWDYSLPSPYDS